MSDRIEKSVEIAAPIERVWDALTDHRKFGTWFLAEVREPFAVGTMTTGRITYPGCEHLPWKAEVVAMEPPRRFAWRWPHMDADQKVREDWPWSLVEFTLEAAGDGTRVTVIESGLDALDPEARAFVLKSNTGGWEEQMRNIKAYVES